MSNEMDTHYLPGLSIVLVAHNEAARLPGWFEKLTWSDEIIVVDSGSTDQTAEIARCYTDKVFPVNNKLNFDINKNFGFSKAKHTWVLSLDADEYLTDELAQEIRNVVWNSECPYTGYRLLRRTYILGHQIDPPEQLIRLFRNGGATFPGQTVHQSLVLQGSVGDLNGEILHYADSSIFERVHKSNMYSECMAAYWYEQKRPFRVWDLLLQPVLLFVKRYILSGGYRQGVLGFIHAVNTSYSMFLRYAKLWSAYELGGFPSPSDDFPPHSK
jgi:glycosyltransferase involved in cell wall biosynthesis